ncbi:MAG: TolC family protein [Deltaproteobacteria bacterium]|jgi:outer membrane protein TolC|nr:TolC family protein [Deltaproteobacteria bacterium]
MSILARLGVLVLGWLAPALAAAGEERSRPLGFDEVLQSVTAHDPRIRQAVERVRKAEGNTTAARGAFDPRLEGNGKLVTGAYYDLRSADAEIRQPTTLWGSEIYAGYRVGLGINDRWPTYRDDQTLSGGEVRAGIEIPIWRGGLIDPERAARARAMDLEEAADQELTVTRLDLELAAARAYWSWVSAGQNRSVAQDLLELAEQRDAQLRRRLQAGSIAEFDVTDNERILLERRAYLVAAERAFEKASFELSLFLRDAKGEPMVPSAARVPEKVAIEPVEELMVERVVEQVVMCHPEVQQARALLEASEVDQGLARNRVAPEIDARFEYSRDLGDLTDTDLDFTLPGNVFEAGVKVSMPLLLRADRGRASAARADVAEKREKVRFVSDQLRARTRDAASAVEAAQERAALTEEVVETSAELAEGERRRFEVGSSNLIFVNLREQQAALARVRYIEAVALAEIERTRWETTTRVTCE